MCFVALTFLTIIVYYSKSTSYICSQFPEKCVCEVHKKEIALKGCLENNGKIGCIKEKIHCTKFRLKSQVEQDTDSCNSNPREDDLCKYDEDYRIKRDD